MRCVSCCVLVLPFLFAGVAMATVTVEPIRPTPADPLAVRVEYAAACLLESGVAVEGGRISVTATEACYCVEEPVTTTLELGLPPLPAGLYAVELLVGKREEGLICTDPPRRIEGTSFTVANGRLGLALRPGAPRSDDRVEIVASADCDFELGAPSVGGSLIRIPVEGTLADPSIACTPTPRRRLPVALGRLAPGPYTALLVSSATGFPEVLASLTFEVRQSFRSAFLLGKDDRFEVAALYQDGLRFDGSPLLLPAHGLPLTADSASFWFFEEDNVELVLKVLAACGINGKFWVFVAGMTDVGVRIIVTDRLSGETKIYENPDGRPFRTVLDGDAFPCL